MNSKQLLSAIFGASVVLTASGQVSFGDLPATLKMGRQIEVRPKILYPQVIASEQIPLDKERSEVEHLPMRIGKQVNVCYDFAKEGEWHTMANGDCVWLLRIQSEGALSLIPSFSDFYLPRGVQLFIYNKDKTQILGSYTHDTHPQGGPFATEMVAGDDMTLELVIPRNKQHLRKQVRLVLSGIGYCYNGVQVYHNNQPTLEIGESSYCMINVNAEEGADWQEEKKGVTQMTMLLTDGWYVCSGTMINTTAQDLRPYLLSACHCYSYNASEEDMLKWQFRFHYESPTAVTERPLDTKTLVGCRLLAASPIKGGSDGLLLELTEEIPLDWDVYFNGWDRRDTITPGRGVGIHHPAGDIKKISTFDEYKTDSWNGQGGPAMDSAHWNLQFVKTKNGHSVTEGGSSGSPLFNSNHLVIGTLTGGDSSCSSPTGSNLYGKLAYHWNQYGDSCDTQMADWLDPMHLGTETLPGIYFNPSAPRIDLGSKVMLELDGTLSEPGEAGSVVVEGFNLTDSIKALAPEQFELSVDGVLWADSVMLDPVGADLLVRYHPTITGNHYGNIEISSPEVRLKRYLRVHASCCREVLLDRELPSGDIQVPYSAQLNIQSEDGPFTVELHRGKLPEGVTISETGLISGTPLEDGLFDLVINVTDRYGCVTTSVVTLYVRSMVVKEYPFEENFEIANFGGIWKQIYQKGEVSWQQGQGINEDFFDVMTPKSGLTNVLFYDKSYDENTTLLVSPQLDLSLAQNAQLHFWYMLPAWNDDIDEMNVYYRTGVTQDWQLLKHYGEDAPQWTEEVLELPELSQEYFVAFGAVGHYGYGIALDDVSFTINNESSIAKTGMNGEGWSYQVHNAMGQWVTEGRSADVLNSLSRGVYLITVTLANGHKYSVRYVVK